MWSGGRQRQVAAGKLTPLLLDGKRVTVLPGALRLLYLLCAVFPCPAWERQGCTVPCAWLQPASQWLLHLVFTARRRMLSWVSLPRSKGSLTA